MAYSPSSQTAWESVYYIQHEMTGGWLLRGIHHYTAQVMIVLLALHMLQVIIDGAYRAPREVNFWIGLVLLNLVLALSLTGYLLPWDQKGYWSTKVATNLMSVVPCVGPQLQRLVVGGPDYGHHTLTRFFALHAGLLPLLMMVFIGGARVRVPPARPAHKEPHKRADAHFWPDQVLKDAVACLGVLLFVLLLVFRFRIVPGGSRPRSAPSCRAPADPSEPFGAARPEWYFLFLFQFLKLTVRRRRRGLRRGRHPRRHHVPAVPHAADRPVAGGALVQRRASRCSWSAGMVLLTAMAIIEDAGRADAELAAAGEARARRSASCCCRCCCSACSCSSRCSRERSFRFNVIVLGSLHPARRLRRAGHDGRRRRRADGRRADRQRRRARRCRCCGCCCSRCWRRWCCCSPWRCSATTRTRAR